MENCFHCDDLCNKTAIIHHNKYFCCNGCKTVFDILNDNDLTYYYDLEHTPGTTPFLQEGKYDFLENNQIVSKLLEFTLLVISFDTIISPVRDLLML